MMDGSSQAVEPVREAWLITGLPGAGKSTVARLLAASMPRAAVVSGDQLAGFMVSGAVWPGQEPAEEARRQQLLTVDHQCVLARSFAEAGFVPVMEYVVIERSRLERYRAALPDLSLHLVVLHPSREVILRRDHDREKMSVAHHFVHLQPILEMELVDLGLWIESSDQTPDETVGMILAQAERARLS